ncbi:hypothetical protein A3K70_04595 [Candidatus Bathyarchaeota archaeon RBG_16_48_13]|nr:MAG: hypothetical protein A3K70_04595 [Candidatus Bathyarchaeota archaeon RBG_16_48_13]
MLTVEILLDILGLLLGGIGLATPTIEYYLKKRISRWLCLAAILLALALSIGLLSLTLGNPPTYVYDGALKIDAYGAFLFTITSLGALFVTLASFTHTSKWTTAPSYFSLILIITVGVYYIIAVNDLVLLLAAWALVSVASYAFVGIKKDEASLEGAAKYALMGIVASAFLLFGIAILYGVTGSTDIRTIVQAASPANMQAILTAIIMIVAAFGFKVGIVPFHGWLPDVYGGVNPILVSYIAGIVKVSGIAALLRIVYPFAPKLGVSWLFLFAAFAIVTMTFGNVAALIQRNFQKMMGYSSLAHVGYMLVGFAAGGSGVSATIGAQGIALHLATYALATTGIFVALSYLAEKGLGTDLDGIAGLWRKMPILSSCIVILVFSLIGMPPLIGFWSKFMYLFFSVIEIAPWLALIAVINTGVSVGYYAQIIRYVLSTRGTDDRNEVRENPRDPAVIAVVLTTVLTVALGLGLAPVLASLLIL